MRSRVGQASDSGHERDAMLPSRLTSSKDEAQRNERSWHCDRLALGSVFARQNQATNTSRMFESAIPCLSCRWRRPRRKNRMAIPYDHHLLSMAANSPVSAHVPQLPPTCESALAANSCWDFWSCLPLRKVFPDRSILIYGFA